MVRVRDYLAKMAGRQAADDEFVGYFLAAGAYLIALLLLVLAWAAGLIAWRGLLACIALIVAVNVGFFAIFRSKLNERSADPQLKLAQTLAAIAVIMFVAFHFERDRSLVLVWCLVVLLFGIFRFKPRDFALTTLFMLGGYALVINLLMALKPAKVEVLVEWYLWAWLALLLPPFAWIGARIGVMRARILRSNQELIDALGTIQEMATHDSLTGLRNRLSIGDALEHAVNKGRRTGDSHAVLFIDLDGFKPVNDTLGHAAGDHLLREIAHRLRSRVRESDIVARLGGDEFVVMVDPVIDRQGLRALAAKLLAVIGEPVALHGGDVTVTASIGIAVFPDDGNEATTLLANADIAMYRAKELGRNRVCEYTPDLGENLVERFELERGMRDALRNGEFVLHYQPKVEFASGCMLGVEALIRWVHPALGMIGPDRFVPIAESNNFIVPLGRWVIEQACRQASAWRQAGLPRIPIAVNLSTNQLVDPTIIDFVSTTLRATGADPAMIEFEITETSLMTNMADTIPILEALRGLGVRLAIDDFGTGYSSLSYLKELPVDVLKIDRTFVRHLPHNRDDLAITRAVIAMAHGLSMKVVAEGVEAQPQFDSLNAEGCDQFQGFYCRPALPGNDLEELVRRHGLVIPSRD